jgi:hypothetical protein
LTYFFWAGIMFDLCFFAMGSMIFYEERGQRRREGKTPSRSSSVGLLTTCALPLFLGVARRIERRPIRRLSVLFWSRTPHSNGACSPHPMARAQHASAITLLQHVFELFQRKWKDEEAPTACLTSFFSRDNSVITPLQFTLICVYVNRKRVNSKITRSFSFLGN